jgi:hypothetical protein
MRLWDEQNSILVMFSRMLQSNNVFVCFLIVCMCVNTRIGSYTALPENIFVLSGCVLASGLKQILALAGMTFGSVASMHKSLAGFRTRIYQLKEKH